MNKFNPKLIKPSRLTSRSPELKIVKCVQNHLNGVETSLTLDLNILSKMREIVIDKKTDLTSSGLSELVKLLNKLPGIFLCPGFAISEVQENYLQSLMEGYEIFLSKYCPGFKDAPNSTNNYKDTTVKPSTFKALSDSEKYFNAVAYLGILRIQIEERNSTVESTKKFESYLSYMAQKADMIGSVEAEAAKYVFNDTNKIKDTSFKYFCQKVKKNFRKGGDSSEAVLKNSLNSARDIMYYRATAAHSNKLLDGKLQDTWLVTADEGLFNLSQSIHFVPNQEGSDSKYFSLIRHNEQKKSRYWNYCDDAVNDTVTLRHFFRELTCEDDEHISKSLEAILECISASEEELSFIVNNAKA